MTTHSSQLGRPSRSTATKRAESSAEPGSPWTPQMYVVCAVMAGVGAVLFFIGLGVVSSEKVYDDQLPGINLAIAGLVLANAAGVLLLLAGRRSVTARRVGALCWVPNGADPVQSVCAPASSEVLVGGEGLTHFHRSDCVMAAGRDWAELDRAAHARAGRISCGVCTP